ncbi:WD40-repeat-containing domain protein [Hyaloraphidium curvatum]|nr:WD40-repeat-containing domain protein [Hyaloraphidium curvatum]
MVLQATSLNNVAVYHVTASARSAIPDWLARRNAKSLRYDQDYRERIELIQDFEFPEASTRVKVTRDGKHIVATGVYKPQMRVFELSELSMKFDRHTDCDTVQFELLSDDWTKSVLLQADRTLEFHSQFGLHFKTRIPKFGRDMAYHASSCDLVLVGASNDAWRLNLEEGRFLNPFATDLPAINVCAINPTHQLFGFGGSGAVLEFWDPRSRSRAASLPLSRQSLHIDPMADGDLEITALSFAMDGLTMGVGTSAGHVLLYDLRNPNPRLVKDHQYGTPIKNITFHPSSGNVVSADTKIIKLWNQETGAALTSIEPPNDINDLCVVEESGLILVANEGVQIQSYYVPALGPAPRWCAFLDNLTEEMEEKKEQRVYDDYKFVTRKELAQLGLDHLVGTNLLRAYMHGFFVDLRLYEKAQSIANPFAFEEYRKRRVQDRLEEERKTRISLQRKLPKVNKALAAKLAAAAEKDEQDAAYKSKSSPLPAASSADPMNPLGDSRFAALFEDEDFQVDATSHEYRLHHPEEKPVADAPLRSGSASEASDEDEAGTSSRDRRTPSVPTSAERTLSGDRRKQADGANVHKGGKPKRVKFVPGRERREQGRDDEAEGTKRQRRGVKELRLSSGRGGRGRGRR